MELKVGSKYEILDVELWTHSFELGEVVTLVQEEPVTHFCNADFYRFANQDGTEQILELQQVALVKEDPEQGIRYLPEGTKIRITKDKWHGFFHSFKEGAIVTLLEDFNYDPERDPNTVSASGINEGTGRQIQQSVPLTHFELVEETDHLLASPVNAERLKESIAQIKEQPKKREKCVYSVEDDKFEYTLTRDRELARQVKAELGGKKAGVVIIRYVATEEIR